MINEFLPFSFLIPNLNKPLLQLFIFYTVHNFPFSVKDIINIVVPHN